MLWVVIPISDYLRSKEVSREVRHWANYVSSGRQEMRHDDGNRYKIDVDGNGDI